MKTKIIYFATHTERADYLDISIDGVIVNAVLRGNIDEDGFVVAVIAENPDLVPDEIRNDQGWYYGKVEACPRRRPTMTT